METSGFVFGLMGFIFGMTALSFAVMAWTQSNQLKEEIDILKNNKGYAEKNQR